MDPSILYHVAPSRVRASIAAHGIDPRRFAGAMGGEYARHTPEDTRGFFAFDSLETALWYARYMAAEPPPEPMDIWEVAATGELWPDGGLIVGADYEDNGSWLHVGPARPRRLVRTVR